MQPKQGQGQEASAERVENESEASRRTQWIPRSRQGEAPGSNLFIFSTEKKIKSLLFCFEEVQQTEETNKADAARDSSSGCCRGPR